MTPSGQFPHLIPFSVLVVCNECGYSSIICKLDNTCFAAKSYGYKLKSNGLRQQPCGTPVFKTAVDVCSLLVRKSYSHTYRWNYRCLKRRHRARQNNCVEGGARINKQRFEICLLTEDVPEVCRAKDTVSSTELLDHGGPAAVLHFHHCTVVTQHAPLPTSRAPALCPRGRTAHH